jgi:protein-disulfide isomerase
LFRQQQQWAVKEPIPPLKAIAKQTGFTEATFNACLADQKILEGIEKTRQRAIDRFKVHSTPTFFINGTIHEGAFGVDDMAKLIDPYLKS